MRRGVFAVLIALCAAPAGAEGEAPARFFGVVADGPLFSRPVNLDRELRLMRSTGVGTIRASFNWRFAQPSNGRIDYTLSDYAVAHAARRRLRILPVVLWAPEWARRDAGELASPPKPEPYARYVAALARRYGPDGRFWRKRPGLPKVPIREWQVWNEPTVENFWTLQPWQHDYVHLLRRTRAAVRRVDRGARIVTAGLVYESWDALEKIYAAGGRGSFDVAALHPFTNRPADVLRLVERGRRVMRRHQDGRLPIFLTEVSWPSSLDHIGERYGYETTEHGMAHKISRAYPLIARARRRLGIERMYWYTWLTRESDPTYPFDYAGLRRLRPDGRVVSKPGLRAFRRVVARLAR